MKVYAYVIANDSGTAPNFEPPFVTLAICKPRIRRTANIGDFVVAFTGRTVGTEPHAVCWAGRVIEKLTFSEYWEDARFKGKKPHSSSTPDNIYRPIGDVLELQANPAHAEDQAAHDLSGEYVLVFKPAWHFGRNGPILPEHFHLRMVGSRRGHRVKEFSLDGFSRLVEWMEAKACQFATSRTSNFQVGGQGCSR